MKIHFRTIFSEGEPFDYGVDYRSQLEELNSKVSRFYSSFSGLSPRGLKSLYPNFEVQNYEPELLKLSPKYPGLKFNPAWARVGYLGWKPLALLHWITSEEVHDGDIVVYRDVDLHRYPEYFRTAKKLPNWIARNMKNKDLLVFSDYSRPFSVDIRPDLLSEVDLPPWWERRFPLPVWGGAMAVRKSEMGVSIVQAWCKMCTPKNLFPFFDGEIPLEFIWHSGEQSILNLLLLDRSAISKVDRKRIKKVYLGESRVIPPARPWRDIGRRIFYFFSPRRRRTVFEKPIQVGDVPRAEE